MARALVYIPRRIIERIRDSLPSEIKVRELGEASTDTHGTTLIMLDIRIPRNYADQL